MEVERLRKLFIQSTRDKTDRFSMIACVIRLSIITVSMNSQNGKIRNNIRYSRFAATVRMPVRIGD
jgi:hypothetical protein